MTVRKPESFIRGALMLSLAGLISRLLGAFYKPVVARIFAPFDGHNGAVGIGLTQVPLTAYMVILSFTSVGLNIGISRLVAERLALSDVQGARRVFQISLGLMVFLGLVSSAVMWFGAPGIATLISEEVLDTIPGFKATAPALVLVSTAAAYRGLFQGFQFMTPNAYSQIIEQVVRVGAGIVLTYLLVRRSVPLGAAGFNLGDVFGAGAALIYLLLVAKRIGSDFWRHRSEETDVFGHQLPAPSGNPLQVIRHIVAVAGPIALVGAVVPLMMLADTFFVFRSLAEVGMKGQEAQAQYGLLTNVFMIVYLPTVVTSSIYTSILPSITGAVTLGRMEEARARAGQAYRMTMLLAFPSQAGLYVLAAGLYALLYGDTSGGGVMMAISWATIPIMLQQTTSGILQGTGRFGLPVRNFLFGALLKALLTALWTPLWGINGAAYATVGGFSLAALLNLYYVEQIVGRTLDFVEMVTKPLVAALAMAGGISALKILLQGRFLYPTVLTFVLIGVGAVTYASALLVVGGIRRQEIEFLPRVGRPLASLLTRARLLR